ncbi:hypothetical protein Bca4012_008307 [Brassica carinata]
MSTFKRESDMAVQVIQSGVNPHKGGIPLFPKNEQRMWLYRRTSSFLFGFVDTIKKKLGVSESAFVITAKVAEEEAAERYEKEVMEFRVESLMFLLLGTLGMLNLFCLAASIMRLVMTSREAGGDVQTMGMQFVIT